MFGITGGLGYMVPFDVCYMYFPKKKGLIAGTISSAYGLGAFVFGFIALFIINPKNEQVNSKNLFECGGYVVNHFKEFVII